MPIVISEFEIVPEPAPDTRAAEMERPPAPRPPTPYELVLAIAQQIRRDARIGAD